MEKKFRIVDIDGERVSLAKTDSIWGWRVVHPIKNEDGTTNWMNLLFGGKGNLITLIFIMIVLGGIVFGVSQMMESCNDMAANPMKYFKFGENIVANHMPDFSYNLSV